MKFRKRFTGKLIACYIGIAFTILWARPSFDSILMAIPLLLFGEMLRIWGTGHLRKKKAVIVSGPYSYMRDPLYLGTLTILTGFMLAARTYELLFPLWLVFFIYYMPYKMKREGEALTRKFGRQYEDYRMSVRSLIPRLTPYQGDGWDTPWSARLVYENSEIGTAVIIVVFYLVLVVKMACFPDLICPAWHWP